ncbi:hypothetical protein CBOM_08022 [Ceraceosorus bombacis]|uniref:Uncharacterized protein n=1 Tax=Ceraceosorus bombacis TaxID=401625 RepID=A0A0P1BSN2_9BASI|nr:hypothetical protein CBOM_08022 [Ceraceosorus bombacis]
MEQQTKAAAARSRRPPSPLRGRQAAPAVGKRQDIHVWGPLQLTARRASAAETLSLLRGSSRSGGP